MFHMQAIPILQGKYIGSANLAFQSMEGGKAEDITVTCSVRGSKTQKAEYRPPVHYSKSTDEMAESQSESNKRISHQN